MEGEKKAEGGKRVLSAQQLGVLETKEEEEEGSLRFFISSQKPRRV